MTIKTDYKREMGYAKLVEAVVYNQAQRGKKESDRAKHRDFAVNSELIQHYSDVFSIDEGKVRRGIYEANREHYLDYL